MSTHHTQLMDVSVAQVLVIAGIATVRSVKRLGARVVALVVMSVSVAGLMLVMLIVSAAFRPNAGLDRLQSVRWRPPNGVERGPTDD